MREARAQRMLVLAAALAAIAACGRTGPDRAARELVTPLLEREAADLKRSGEQLDPVLGVKATWTVAGIDVTERPGDADRPWAGAIRFKIRAETRDTGGVVVDEFERRFDYVYTASVNRWIFQLAPSPAP